jgi:hypothetical protein
MPAMSNLSRLTRTVLLLLVAAGSVAMAALPSEPPAEPARVEISVAPESVSPGGEAEVTLRLTPKSGIKINRYPQIKLAVPGVDGLAVEAEVSLGNDAPPPAGQMESNYFDEIDPLRLQLAIDGAARAGKHEIEGRLVYYYCVKKSGFCAPARLNVKIPLQVK